MTTTSVKPGDVLAGKYRVERVLGSGGMGYVVAARHLQLDQMVAMKFLRRGSANFDETEATGRFLREAKAVVKLRDEHVARVFDVGKLDDTGEPYIVMEYLDGSDLSALSKKRGPMPVQECVEYVMQACEALAEAHSLGIVHRDVKLANLFLTRGAAGSPLVKVLDFGISKMNPFGESDHEMTRTASMLGSPRFMSPEQMRDPRSVDPRSDLWSLGVVLYRLVAGKPPFEADTLGRLLTMVMHEHPDTLAQARPDVPPMFSDVVMRCLQKDPNHRFANVAELAYALVPFTVDPQRARGVADRIAGTLNLSALPRTVEIGAAVSAIPAIPSRPSAPPAQTDTGTAAPWAGTHGGFLKDPAARSNVIWAAVALAGFVLAGGVFAFVHHDRSRGAAAAAASETATTTTATHASNAGTQAVPTTTTTANPLDPNAAAAWTTPPAAPMAGVPEVTPAGLPNAAAASAKAAAAPSLPAQAAPAGARPRGGSVKPAKADPTPKGRPTAPSSPGKSEDGIPTTRD